MFNKLHIYSRITIALVGALLVSQLMVREVFLGATPRVRTDVADRLVERTLALVNVDNYLAFFRGNKSEDPIETFKKNVASLPAQQIVPGVYAKETEEGVYTEIKYYEVDWQEMPYQKKDGTTITIKIPKGQNPPPPGMF